MERKDRRPKLSKREIELLELAGTGLTDAMIGDRLGLEYCTIATYWTRIRLKMQSASRTEAVAVYYRMEVERLTAEVRDLQDQLELERRIERAHRVNDQRLDAIFDRFHIGTVLVENGRIIHANLATEILTGYSSRDLNLLDPQSLWGNSLSAEHNRQVVTKTGHTVVLSVVRVPLSPFGSNDETCIYFLKSAASSLSSDDGAEDIPESGDRIFRDIVQMLPIGIAVCDSDGNITDRNPRYSEITQFPAQAPSDCSSHSNLNAQATLSDRRSLAVMTHDLQSSIQGVEWYFVPSLGKVVSYLLSAIPLNLHEEEGSVLLVLQELMNPNDLTNLVSSLGKA